MKAAHAHATRDSVLSVRVSGADVTVTFRPGDASGRKDAFRVEYTVRNGVIIAARKLPG
jgi:hypothetical protein